MQIVKMRKHKIFLMGILFLLIISFSNLSVYGYNWPQVYGNEDGQKVIPDGDTALKGVEKNGSIGLLTEITGIPVTGNFDGNESNIEIFTAKETGEWAVFSREMTLLFDGDEGSTMLNNYAAMDINSDGIDEIVVAINTGGASNLTVFEYNGTNFTKKHGKSLAVDIERKAPTCDSTFCYFQDNSNTVIKYNPSTNSIITSFSLGTNTGSSDRFLSPQILDCNPDISGNEVVFVSDYDNDGTYDDVAMVSQTAFTSASSVVYTGLSKPSDLLQQNYGYVTCGEFDNEDIMGINYIRVRIGGAPGVTHQGFELYRYNSSFKFERFKSVNISYTGSPGGGSALPDTWSQIDFLDYNNDGKNEYCYVFMRNNFGNITLTSTCVDESDNDLLNVTASSLTTQGLDLPFNRPNRAYRADFDDDGADDYMYGEFVLEDNGNVFDYDTKRPGNKHYAYGHSGGDCLEMYYAPGSGTNEGAVYYIPSTSSACGTGNSIPSIEAISFSTVQPQLIETVSVLALAEDNEGDELRFAYDCEFSPFGEIGDRKFTDDFDQNESIDSILEKYNMAGLGCGSNTYIRDTLIGNVWNLSFTSCLTTPIRNVTNDGSTLLDSQIDVHFIPGFDAAGTTEPDDGLLQAGRDETGLFLYAIIADAFESGGTVFNNYYRVEQNGDLTFLTTTTNQVDRVIVTLDLDNQLYSVSIDTDFDGEFEFISDTFDFLNSQNQSRGLFDLYFQTLGTHITNQTFFDLTTAPPTAAQWLDTVFVEVNNKPPFQIPNRDSVIINGIIIENSFTFSIPVEDLNSIRFECSYPTIGTRVVRTYVTDIEHPNDYSSFVDQTIIVTATPEEFELLQQNNFIYPNETSDNISISPEEQCGDNAICNFFWMFSFPSKLSKTLDAENGTNNTDTITFGATFAAVIIFLTILVRTGNLNRTIIVTWFYTLIMTLIGFMNLAVLLLMTFLLAIIISGWKRSHEFGTGGQMSNRLDDDLLP